MKKVYLIASFLIIIQNLSISQQVNDSIFQLFKEKIESSDFPPYQGSKFKFNRTKFIVRLNTSKDSLIIERIKVPENDYSDPTQDKEIRSVALKDIDFNSINIRKVEDYYFFEFFTIDQQNLVNYKLIKEGQTNFMVNNTIGIGRFYNKTTSKKEMKKLVELFKNIFS